MKKITISFLILSSSLCFSVWGQETSDDSISSIEWMIGKWEVSATLEASDGSSTKESGFRDCSWVAKKRVIRCDCNLRNVDSTYSNGSKYRSVITYITYNKAEKHYKVTWIRADGNHTNVVFNKRDDSVLYSEFTYEPPSLGFDMLINTTISRIDADHITELEILKNEENNFSERFELKATRIE